MAVAQEWLRAENPEMDWRSGEITLKEREDNVVVHPASATRHEWLAVTLVLGHEKTMSPDAGLKGW